MAVSLLLALLLFGSLGSAQNCTAITREDIDGLLPLYLNDHSVVLVNHNITCLALSEAQGRYRYVTVLVKVQSSMTDFSLDIDVMIDIGCSKDRWNTSVLGVIDAVTMLENDVIPVETRLDCSVCAAEQLLPGLNITVHTSDPNTHCVACSTGCSSGGVGSCTGPGDDHCCNVYENGACAGSCSSGYKAAVNHTCVPTQDDDAAASSQLIPSHTAIPCQSLTPTSPAIPQSAGNTVKQFIIVAILISSVTTGVVTILISVSITLVIVFNCCGGKMIGRGTKLSSTTSRVSPRSQSFINLEKNPAYCTIQTPPKAGYDEESVVYDVPETFKSKAHTYMTVIG